MILGSRVLLVERNNGITTNPIPPNISSRLWRIVTCEESLEKNLNYLLENELFVFENPNKNIIRNVKPDQILAYFNVN